MADNRLERIEAKLDDTVDHLISIDKTLIKQEASLSDHIRRTEILEGQIKPVQEHVNDLKSIIKVLKVLALIATIIEGFHYFGH